MREGEREEGKREKEKEEAVRGGEELSKKSSHQK